MTQVCERCLGVYEIPTNNKKGIIRNICQSCKDDLVLEKKFKKKYYPNMGTIERQQKLDEFKIRLKILELKSKWMVDTDYVTMFTKAVNELEVEFNKYNKEEA